MNCAQPVVARHRTRAAGWTTSPETNPAQQILKTPSRGGGRPMVRLSRESQILSLSQDPWERGAARELSDVVPKLMKINT